MILKNHLRIIKKQIVFLLNAHVEFSRSAFKILFILLLSYGNLIESGSV